MLTVDFQYYMSEYAVRFTVLQLYGTVNTTVQVFIVFSIFFYGKHSTRIKTSTTNVPWGPEERKAKVGLGFKGMVIWRERENTSGPLVPHSRQRGNKEQQNLDVLGI